jgi:phosphoribosyl-ATP pyrophosphohydrolase
MSGKWHNSEIEKGVHGELSKVLEEVLEAIDAEEQGLKVMIICELADIAAALSGVAKKYGLTMDDLIAFAEKRAQVAGRTDAKPAK